MRARAMTPTSSPSPATARAAQRAVAHVATRRSMVPSTSSASSSSASSSMRRGMTIARVAMGPERANATGGGGAGAGVVANRAVVDADVVASEEDQRDGGRILSARRRSADGEDASVVRVVNASEDWQFEIAATLRATAFYDDLIARQALPFPPRFMATFHREFAQRERKALRERTTKPVGYARESRCLMTDIGALGLVGCLDVSVRQGPCASQVNGICVAEGATYAYVDNVAVDASARRRGAAKMMLENASDFAVERGMTEMWTHVHCDNVAARRLYHRFGFRAPSGTFPLEGSAKHFAGTRLSGLVLMRAPLPLVYVVDRVDRECGCGACFDQVEKCICLQ
jgi:ribosomal protein S18 acetylase RimI-like enzyme